MGIQSGFGGLKIAGGSSAFYAPAAGAKLTGWSAIDASPKGDGSVTESTDDSRLTLKQGVYLVEADVTLEGEFVSGTSGDALGVIDAELRLDQSIYDDAKQSVQLDSEGEEEHVHVHAIVEVTSSDTGQLELYLSSDDSSGNDVIVREARLSAVRLL